MMLHILTHHEITQCGLQYSSYRLSVKLFRASNTHSHLLFLYSTPLPQLRLIKLYQDSSTTLACDLPPLGRVTKTWDVNIKMAAMQFCFLIMLDGRETYGCKRLKPIWITEAARCQYLFIIFLPGLASNMEVPDVWNFPPACEHNQSNWMDHFKLDFVFQEIV